MASQVRIAIFFFFYQIKRKPSYQNPGTCIYLYTRPGLCEGRLFFPIVQLTASGVEFFYLVCHISIYFCFSQAQVLYDFEGQPGTSELTITAGEVVTVTSKDVGEGWWEGSNSRGKTGIFPAAYVEVCTTYHNQSIVSQLTLIYL